jgi:hypothetical protein
MGENLLLYSSKPSLGVFQLAGHLISYTIDLAPSSCQQQLALRSLFIRGVLCLQKKGKKEA